MGSSASGSSPAGNQSWKGVAKNFCPTQRDYLFVRVGDGRRWFRPSAAAEGAAKINRRKPKYADYEVEPGHPLRPWLPP
jgi:hypothetical protein